jgi:thiosulfate dehydrogenase (quinone) large subunit
MSEYTSSDPNARAVALLRIAIGVIFLIFAEYKIVGTEFMGHGGFTFWIMKFLEQGTYPFMEPVLRNFVLPHAKPLAYLVAYGELAIGLSLVLGLLVRVASAFGFVFMMTLLFSSNYPGAGAPFWEYFGASLEHSVLALCFLTFFLGRPDSAWSISVLLAQKRSPER